MPAKITKEEFIARAIAKHGDVYDYKNVEYVNSQTKVRLICKIHGEFQLLANSHLQGQGCSICGRAKAAAGLRKTNQQFIAEAQTVHGGFYDYSKTNYVQAREKVEIICPRHGAFFQVASEHVGGAGCRQCADEEVGKNSRLDPAVFVNRATELHGNKFDYSESKYTTAWNPITIICREHGPFKQAPVNHLASTYGCPSCATAALQSNPNSLISFNQKNRLSYADFLRRATEVHGNKYDYSVVEIKSVRSKVSINCPTHGPFMQSVGDHLSGNGCRKCGSELTGNKLRQSVDAFIARAKAVHGDYYDYSHVLYKDALSPVLIGCPVHGYFEQVPHTHLRSGCRQCADDELPGAYSLKVLSRDPTLAAKLAVLYYLHFESASGESFYKIGITLKSIKQRFAGYGAAGYKFTVLGEKRLTLMDAFKAEQTLVNSHVKAHHYSPMRGNRERTTKFGGRKECFSVPLPVALTKLFD